jgi:hypothetical protein
MFAERLALLKLSPKWSESVMCKTSSCKVALAFASAAIVTLSFMTIDATAGSSERQARNQSEAAIQRHSGWVVLQRTHDLSDSGVPGKTVREVVNPTDYQRGGAN